MIESVKHHRINPSTENILPETNIALEIGRLEDEISFEEGLFSRGYLGFREGRLISRESLMFEAGKLTGSVDSHDDYPIDKHG